MNPYSEIQKTFEIQNGIKMYNFEKCLGALQTLGNYHFGNRFKIYEEDLPVIRKLVIYAIRDTATMIQLDLNPDKALLLSGPVGCGKTSMMFLLNYFCAPQSNYKIKPCREVAFEFAKKGYEALVPYTQKEHKQNRLPSYCFDDLGTENNLKYYGNECNVMAEILLSRYDLYISKKLQTHITTNLSANEIEKQYGNRVRSRLRELCNLIAFDNGTKDKRK